MVLLLTPVLALWWPFSSPDYLCVSCSSLGKCVLASKQRLLSIIYNLKIQLWTCVGVWNMIFFFFFPWSLLTSYCIYFKTYKMDVFRSLYFSKVALIITTDKLIGAKYNWLHSWTVWNSLNDCVWVLPSSLETWTQNEKCLSFGSDVHMLYKCWKNE